MGIQITYLRPSSDQLQLDDGQLQPVDELNTSSSVTDTSVNLSVQDVTIPTAATVSSTSVVSSVDPDYSIHLLINYGVELCDLLVQDESTQLGINVLDECIEIGGRYTHLGGEYSQMRGMGVRRGLLAAFHLKRCDLLLKLADREVGGEGQIELLKKCVAGSDVGVNLVQELFLHDLVENSLVLPELLERRGVAWEKLADVYFILGGIDPQVAFCCSQCQVAFQQAESAAGRCGGGDLFIAVMLQVIITIIY